MEVTDDDELMSLKQTERRTKHDLSPCIYRFQFHNKGAEI